MFEYISPEAVVQTIALIAAASISAIVTFILLPPIMKRMKERGITSKDRNKREVRTIPQLGGIAILFGFPIGISIAAGILKLTLTAGYIAVPVLAAIGVFFIGAIFGLIDDISDIPSGVKAIALAFAALPLMIVTPVNVIIGLPFGLPSLDFTTEPLRLFFWIILVPIATTGIANAMNLSAGYDGLVTGQVTIICLAMLAALIIREGPSADLISPELIFASLMGCAIGLNYYCGYPAIAFVGNVGTFAFGTGIAAGIIIGSLEIAGIIAIIPAFYEGFAAVYYMIIKKVNRKPAVANPIIDENGRMHVPKGAERFTLAYLILSKKPMTENNLVRTILSIYLIFGVLAVIISAV